jgi:hypothetical protein
MFTQKLTNIHRSTEAKKKKKEITQVYQLMDKMWYIYTTQYYLAIKRNGVWLRIDEVLMNLENLLSKRSQTKKRPHT